MNALWIPLALGAHFLLAFNGVADKFLLSKAVRHPIAYAFYTGITGPLVWVIAPFGFRWIGISDLFIAIMGGVCFPVALYFFDTAIQQTSISRILPIEGGLVPIFTLVFAYVLLGERLTPQQLSAFIFLVIGAVLISFRYQRGGWHAVALGNAAVAAILFALSATITKYIFDQSNFVSGLIWTRLGFFLASLSFLVAPRARRAIFDTPKQVSSGNKLLYYSTRITGMLAGFMQNLAVAWGSVTIVNALQGVQFVFLLMATSILSLRFPKILKEKITGAILVQKILAIIAIGVGLALLTL
jgi:drug/metabolite transporter (DMT)-like permease